MDEHAKYLLTQAANEIKYLRRENEVLGAQVFVVNAFAQALAARPPGNVSSADIVWAIDAALTKAEKEEE